MIFWIGISDPLPPTETSPGSNRTVPDRPPIEVAATVPRKANVSNPETSINPPLPSGPRAEAVTSPRKIVSPFDQTTARPPSPLRPSTLILVPISNVVALDSRKSLASLPRRSPPTFTKPPLRSPVAEKLDPNRATTSAPVAMTEPPTPVAPFALSEPDTEVSPPESTRILPPSEKPPASIVELRATDTRAPVTETAPPAPVEPVA